MHYTPDLATHVLAETDLVLKRTEPDIIKVDLLWNTLAFFRANVLAILLRNTIGPKVYSGPFKGMSLTPAVMVKTFGPVLTGCYEHELHETFEKIIPQPYARILNIGCAFGYYSTGLALRMPGIPIEAFDISVDEQKRCHDMAVLNGVQDRIKVGGEFRGEDFAAYADQKTLLLVDIEGAETTLLDPERYPALKQMDVIVELHDLFDATISKTITARFAPTHDIEIIRNRSTLFDFTAITGEASYTDPFDGLIITWERRDGPTPWAVMRAR
ncbi:MAG: hypothetical protein M3N08_08100 [Pseudomonadota bacterium]|nr:hypothetical protein [Pseudomonadota bacterium]